MKSFYMSNGSLPTSQNIEAILSKAYLIQNVPEDLLHGLQKTFLEDDGDETTNICNGICPLYCRDQHITLLALKPVCLLLLQTSEHSNQ